MLKITDEQLLRAALTLAGSVGFNRVTRDAVAARVGCAPAMVNVRFGTMAKFERALIRYAIRQENLCVIAQGLAMKNRYARKASASLQLRALDNLKGPQ